ncbi:MAG: ABC transporter ATP-binding protein [Pyrinomonadaceae bacterium]
MKPIVKIENVSKRYRVGGLHPGYLTFRDMLGSVLGAPWRRLRQGSEEDDRQTLWALKDINLEVRPGELVGIIGHNGAGKSTLLKIMSRITKPATGRVEMYGRVGSLLEVGTGFHPELTGRENVFLSGAILGMSRAEIARKFDEIVAFSEIERFIDTPVKRYSSGMYVRLAFSVAAHLEPEILIMDEVLAVGDAAFQQKCLDKLHEIRQQGRTIFFVSHNMPAITRLCRRAILLERGRITSDGVPQQVVNDYLRSSWKTGAERAWDDAAAAPGTDVARLRRVRVRTETGETTAAADIGRPFGIDVTYDVLQPGHLLAPVAEFVNEEGTHLFSTHDTGPGWRRRPRPTGRYTSTVWVPANLMAEGSVLVHVSLMSHFPATRLHARERHAVAFQVVDQQDGDSARGDYVGPMPGVVRPLLSWTTDVGGAAGEAERPPT